MHSQIIDELETRHHRKESRIRLRINEINEVLIQTRDISEKATGVIKCLQDEREELEEEYRYEAGKFEAYEKRKHELEEAIGKDYTHEEVMRHIERDAIREFFDD